MLYSHIGDWSSDVCSSDLFTDGRQIGAVLDRNGLRPSRYWITKSGLVVLASEFGVLDFKPEEIESKGRLKPGPMFFVDTEAGRIIEDDEIKDPKGYLKMELNECLTMKREVIKMPSKDMLEKWLDEEAKKIINSDLG
jgi:hypothetical protein